MFKHQSKLDGILTNLRKIAGLTSVQQDDFDSHSINVFLELQWDAGRPVRRMQDIKRDIKKMVGDNLRFCDAPEPIYDVDHFMGKTTKTFVRYNDSAIKICVEF